ncbi:pyridoxine 5'-phosphate synthase [bacterium]|nr:pyridoxine 5'-phosphate synthase [bacterium]
MARLCVNVDHVATVRQARRAREPDPVEAAKICEKSGAAGITIHLREDRRHIQHSDLERLRETVTTFLNLEMAATDEMVRIALEQRPDQVTLVPENREEITTEGGLDAIGQEAAIRRVVERLQEAGIPVSLFVDPTREQIEASARTGARLVELHTGRYCNAPEGPERDQELKSLVVESARAQELGLIVNAGHGLHYDNVVPVAAIGGMNELNIGHTIISRAIMVGLELAVREMIDLIDEGNSLSPL